MKLKRVQRIFTGFKEPVVRETYLNALESGDLAELLNVENTEPGDFFFTPAGRIHAIGAGILLAEIQQTSDITYRIFDWSRKDANGKDRELHVDMALDAIDFKASGKSRIKMPPVLNKTENLVNCEFFTTNVIKLQ